MRPGHTKRWVGRFRPDSVSCPERLARGAFRWMLAMYARICSTGSVGESSADILGHEHASLSVLLFSGAPVTASLWSGARDPNQRWQHAGALAHDATHEAGDPVSGGQPGCDGAPGARPRGTLDPRRAQAQRLGQLLNGSSPARTCSSILPNMELAHLCVSSELTGSAPTASVQWSMTLVGESSKGQRSRRLRGVRFEDVRSLTACRLVPSDEYGRAVAKTPRRLPAASPA
jgi:hypothetical protein